MEPFYIEIIKQVPSLAVLAFIVTAFLKHLQRRDALISQLAQERAELHKEATKVIRENTHVLARVGTALDRIEPIIRQIAVRGESGDR